MSESKKSVEQIEQERLSRRQALRKLGFGAGLSAFMLLGVDDLARMVGREMERRTGDSRLADQIAREFQGVGIAFAAGPSKPGPSSPHQTPCANCCGKLQADNGVAGAQYQECIKTPNANIVKCGDVYNEKKCTNWSTYFSCIGTQTCPDCSTSRCPGVTPPSPSGHK